MAKTVCRGYDALVLAGVHLWLSSPVSECEACPKDTERANCPALAGLQIAKLAHRVVPNEEVVRKSP